jgi:hypothetical protein
MTTAGLVKTALRELWQDTFDQSVVRVTFGKRVTIKTGAAWLAIGNVAGDSQPEALGPQRTMKEEYDVECVLSWGVNGSVDDQERVTLQVLEWAEGAEHAVRAFAGQNLGVPGVEWAAVIGGFSLREAEASETQGPIGASFSFNVHVRAIYRLS